MTTLPGDVPELVEQGSVVLQGHRPRVPMTVTQVNSTHAVAAGDTDDDLGPSWCECRLDGFDLDLSSRTSRAHAAWWLDGQGCTDAVTPKAKALCSAISARHGSYVATLRAAYRGLAMQPEYIEILRKAVLHVAGREVKP